VNSQNLFTAKVRKGKEKAKTAVKDFEDKTVA